MPDLPKLRPGVALQRFSSPETLAQAAAEQWADALASQPQGRQTVALSGGRIAQTFFKAVVAEFTRRQLSAGQLEFFWADERCVPPSHEESNYRIADELLLKPLRAPAHQVHRILGENPPAEAVELAGQDFTKVAGLGQLDYVFLGMGEDGHIASLFPGLPRDLQARGEPFIAVTGPKPPPQRVSMTYQTLANAHNVWVLASGKGKEKALEQSLFADKATPLGILLSLRANTVIFSDLDVRNTT